MFYALVLLGAAPRGIPHKHRVCFSFLHHSTSLPSARWLPRFIYLNKIVYNLQISSLCNMTNFQFTLPLL
jgi:hypothetical protein